MAEERTLLLYGELCACRAAFAAIVERKLDNRLALQALRSAITEIRQEIYRTMDGVPEEAVERLLSRMQGSYGETARFELADMIASPHASMLN